ncbi:MAG: hypothetical protein IPP68_10260 [Elusimicrobia bacterium]|nr:hypothetical protein [Elusimicrobiota bacterium]
MNKAEMDNVFHGEKFIKEQIVKPWPGCTAEETRAYLRSLMRTNSVEPKSLIETQLPIDGSVKAYSYLIKEERRFANPIYVEALFVFVDTKKDVVIGWADIEGLLEVRLWKDYF